MWRNDPLTQPILKVIIETVIDIEVNIINWSDDPANDPFIDIDDIIR